MNPSSSGLRTKTFWPQEPFSFLPTRSPGFLHLPPPSNYPPPPSCLPPLWCPPPHPSPKPHSGGFFLVSSICVRFCHHCISCSSVRGGGRCASVASIVRGGERYCTAIELATTTITSIVGRCIFFCLFVLDFSISCNNNNVIARRGGGGRGGRCMKQHYHCAYTSNNHLHCFGGVIFFSFVCVRFYHCCILCDNIIIIKARGRRCTSGATTTREGGRHYHAQQHCHHTCNNKSHLHHFARGICFICLCEILPSPYIV